MKNSITLLGTGTSVGIPMIGCKCEVCTSIDKKDKRLRTSALVNINNRNLLIDIGPDFRYQALKYNINSLDGILLTHPHFDHIAGYDDLRGLNFSTNKSIPLYANSFTYNSLKKQFYYAFENNDYKAIPQSNYIEIFENNSFNISDVEIIPIQIFHGKMPCIGYRIGKIAYLTDVNSIHESQFSYLKNLDILFLDSLRIKMHHSHFSLEESIEIAQKIGAKKTYFIHISHHMGLHCLIEKKLPDNIFLGFDGLKLDF